MTDSIPTGRTALFALTAVLLAIGGDALAEALFYGKIAGIDVWGVESQLAFHAVLLTALLLGCILTRRLVDFPKAVIGASLMMAVQIPVSWYVWTAHPEFSHTAWVTTQMVPPLLVLLWVLRAQGVRATMIAACWGAGYLAADRYLSFTDMLIQADVGQADVGQGDDGMTYTDQPRVDVEALYAAQTQLLDDQIAVLAPQRPGKPDMFALLLGGTSYQSVFRSEVEKVGPILNADYASGARTLCLVNSEDAPFDYPMANKANLKRALEAIAARMGPEDMAFILMTSHGGQEVFQLAFPEADTHDLAAKDFAAMLTESHIGPAVIVLSACHAGSFLDDIAAPNRLIIAAAAADRTSFGCANGRDWTEFGQSYFDMALRAEPDPRLAFTKAAADVRMKEFWRLRTPSLPQMQEGAAFGPLIDRFLAAHQADLG